MPIQFKTAGEAMHAAMPGFLAWSNLTNRDKAYYETIAQTFLRSEWGESETLCSECGQRGTHRTEECPFPKTPLLFAELENDTAQAPDGPKKTL